MAEAERLTLQFGFASRQGYTGIYSILSSCTDASDRRRPMRRPPARPTGEFHALVRVISDLAIEVATQRDAAVASLSPEERKMAFDLAPRVLTQFGPQVSLDDTTRKQLAEDRTWMEVSQKIDWLQMASAAASAARLADPVLMNSLAARAPAETVRERPPGVEGDLLYARNTPKGWIIVGGKGPNSYAPTEPVLLIIDLGGDDKYIKQVGTPFDQDHGVSIVVDVSGDDTYETTGLDIGCGILGVGLVVDLKGNDTYKCDHGIGVGAMGFGMVIDVEGDDTYEGKTWAIGVGIGGIGVVFDLTGKDHYTADMYGIGLGCSLGVGALVDTEGDDTYRVGFKIPSGYNGSDAPSGDPKDPNFQYEAWGMGMGLGRRIWPVQAMSDMKPYASAGGIGFVVDTLGNDQYDSSNFSQGCGYFFGIGIKMDVNGNDHHRGARYGMGSGAHYAMGLFLDYKGDDVYSSSGPTYNCGCSWDHSAFLFIDGSGNDQYLLGKSAGPARADIGSWGVAADLAGSDRYEVQHRPGAASDKGLSAFLDAKGDNHYFVGDKIMDWAGKTETNDPGGLFVDRANPPQRTATQPRK